MKIEMIIKGETFVRWPMILRNFDRERDDYNVSDLFLWYDGIHCKTKLISGWNCERMLKYGCEYED